LASQVFEFDFSSQGDEVIDSVYFNSGNLSLRLNSTIPYPLDYTVKFRSLAQNGASVVESGSIPSSGNAEVSNALNALVGLLHLDASGNPSANKFILELAYTFDVPAGGNLAASDGVSFDMQLTNAGYTEFFGNVGSKSLDINQQ